VGEEAKLPLESVPQVRRLPGVISAGSTSVIDKLHIYRNSEIEAGRTGGLTVAAADLDLLKATGTPLLHGVWLNEATADHPVVVLGKGTAERLGIQTPGSLVWLGGQQFAVAGILDASPLAPELNNQALIGQPIAAKLFGHESFPTTIYQRSDEAMVADVRKLLPPTVNPQSPNEVQVSRPSDGRWLHRAPGGRHRRGQHHGHFGAGTPARDRFAAITRRYPPARAPAVPL